MSDLLASYSFLPWLRQGLANNIIPGDPEAVKLRAAIPIQLTVSATTVDGSAAPEQAIDKTVELYGPGDVIGIDSKVIVKTEPRNWITNFEPNYLPYIEFYEEDFPWRYTPAGPDGDRLRPWLSLVVLREEEFADGANRKDKPLPFFTLKEGIKAADLFPAPAELWAWAHVHVNSDLSEGADPNAADAARVNTRITDLIQQHPDQAYSRIISPRKLATNQGYHAFLIPTFESGRLAGLGSDLPTDLTAAKCAWEADENIDFPYYHRWYFKTGHAGDFEYLVNLLEPRPAPKTLGVRDMDVLHPGANLPPIGEAALNGILKLGGALRVPFDAYQEADKAEVIKYDEWDEHPYPHTFTEAMARRINLADDYVDAAKRVTDVNQAANILLEDHTGDPDPVITSPLYGRWHGLQQRLLVDKSNNSLANHQNWIHELNLDPRFRVAAGLGTQVVQKGQEAYMQAAWEQAGKITEANNRIRMAQLAQEVSARYYGKHLSPLVTDRAFAFTAPVQKRILYQSLTLHRQVEESVLPPAIVSGPFRSIARPRGAVMKRLGLPDRENSNSLISGINEGKIVISAPKTDPAGAINLRDLAGFIHPGKIQAFMESLQKKYKLDAGTKEIKEAVAVSQKRQTPEAIAGYALVPNFEISGPGSKFTPVKGNKDSEEGKRFKSALKGAFTLSNVQFPERKRKQLILTEIMALLMHALDPALTIRKRTLETIKIPGYIRDNMVETFAPVMVYPEIDLPMYKPLADTSTELFLPNINLIPQNSITLLENNQKFIEAYLVGVNHEMSRELLWREYPTDLRGTYFRQFWDVSGFLPPQPVPGNIRETLRDIPPIHQWSKTDTTLADPAEAGSPRKNELGQHNQRALTSGKTQLVLVIRGELLKKYPTAVVYAHKADWGMRNEVPDVGEERVFMALSEAEKLNPPASKIKTPLFEAKVEPDIYFFGFDLDDAEARGTLNPRAVGDEPGWFFVLKERPGEPRFGLDIEKARNEAGEEQLLHWHDLSWQDIETPEGACIQLNKTIALPAPGSLPDQVPDDIQARWSPDTNAAELAYILYQVPVLVGVHASRMLP